MPTLKLFADISQLPTIRDFVARAGSDIGLDEWGVYSLKLAVDEACTNIVQHAYGGQGGEIEVTVEAEEEGVRITLLDWGEAFDPGSIPTPDITASLEQRPLGGLGLFLMRQLMDEVHFEFDADRGNRLTMKKNFQGRGGNP
jgi:serine/threonine-protein kinase RsbW